jgi:HSP20 family protein
MFWRERNGNMYGGARRSLFGELDRLQREMNRLVSGRAANRGEFPLVNIWSGADGVQATAELPGVDADDVTISVVGNTLTLSGERPEVSLADDEMYHRRERVRGSFSRTIELPFRVDVENVQAAFGKGVLTITLPRAADEKPRKIAINAD